MSGKTIIRVLLLLHFFMTGKSQSLSPPELKWALGHPFAALKVKKITRQCDPLFSDRAVKQQLDSFASGGKLDACRHMFYMASYAQKIKVKKVRKLGIAHEKANYKQFLKLQNEEGEIPDSLSSVMDLQNNELGFAIGCNNRSLTREELRNKIIEEIKNGKAVIFKRDAAGNYLDCENKPLKINDYRKRWFIPKCLVPSSYKSSS